jgi:hypothetical protein
MLEASRILIRPAGADAFAVLDADTGESLGTAAPPPGRWRRWLSRWLPRGWRSGTVLVRERPDDSLVFQVRWGRERTARVAVFDALDVRVGHFPAAPAGEPLAAFAPDGRLVFAAAREVGGAVVLRGPDGEPLARIARHGPSGGVCVEFGGRVADEPFVKMLAVAAALTLDLLDPLPP